MVSYRLEGELDVCAVLTLDEPTLGTVCAYHCLSVGK